MSKFKYPHNTRSKFKAKNLKAPVADIELLKLL